MILQWRRPMPLEIYDQRGKLIYEEKHYWMKECELYDMRLKCMIMCDEYVWNSVKKMWRNVSWNVYWCVCIWVMRSKGKVLYKRNINEDMTEEN